MILHELISYDVLRLIWWLLLGVLACYMAMVLFGYSKADPGWSHAVQVERVSNPGGRFGAWLADTSYFGFGYSVWWAVLAAVFAWGRSLRRWMRGETLEGHAWRDNLTFWGGLLLLLHSGRPEPAVVE
mgnify:CR=1 FL=1